MTSSFSLFLGSTPTAFKLDCTFLTKALNSEGASLGVTWTESEPWDSLRTKLKAAFRAFSDSAFCESCQVKLHTTGSYVTVELRPLTEQPVLQSLEFSRAVGNGACDERYLRKGLFDLDVGSVERLRCHEGFPFFVPGLVPAANWKSLRQLHLVNAGLNALPSTIGKVTLLKELRLSHNKLTSLPAGLGELKLLEVLVADHNQIISIQTDLGECSCLRDLNLEYNSLTVVVLDLRNFPKLSSLQLYGNPLSYIPELSVCRELRSLSLVNLRVWSDVTFSQFEVTIGGTTTLSWGTKLNPLFSVLFSRSSSHHPLLGGALSRLAEFRTNCEAILDLPGAPLQQLILMVLSPNSIVQEQAAKIIGLMAANVQTAETLVKSGILDAILSVLGSERLGTQVNALKALAVMGMASDGAAVSLMVPELVKKLKALIDPSRNAAVRHLALETLGNLSFALENKQSLLKEVPLKDTLKELALGESHPTDKRTRMLACRCLAILGEYDEVDAIVGRPPIGNRGIRILSIDGGGMKGLSAVKMLRELELRTGKRISDLFDLIGGTSSGAMLAVALGILQYSLNQCDEIYKKLAYLAFNQAHQEDQAGWKDSLIRMYRSGQQGLRVVMAGCKHDASTFETLLQDMCRPMSDKAIGSLYIDSAVLPGPKVFAASTLTSIVPAVPFLFRNYEFSVPHWDAKMKETATLGSSKFDIWQGVRASSAAPYFFEDFKLDKLHFQDGATTANNPTILAVQQAKLLWPEKPIDCVVSIGLGAVPAAQREKSSSSFIENGSVLIESSCSVERTHEVMSLMASMTPEMKYFRFNPVDKRCGLALDDLDAEKWNQLEAATMDYMERNQSLFQKAAEILTRLERPVSPLDGSNGYLKKEERPFVILQAHRGTHEQKDRHSALHCMENCAGTLDLAHMEYCPNEGYQGDIPLPPLSPLPDESSRTPLGRGDQRSGFLGKEFLQRFSEGASGKLSGVHLDLEMTEADEKLVLNWSTTLWPLTEPSASINHCPHSSCFLRRRCRGPEKGARDPSRGLFSCSSNTSSELCVSWQSLPVDLSSAALHTCSLFTVPAAQECARYPIREP